MLRLLLAAGIVAFTFPAPAASQSPSPQVVGANVSASGSVAALNGNLDVYGTVSGDALAIRGDIIVHPGARIRGDAITILGNVRNLGGTIDGKIRSHSSAPRMLARTGRAYAIKSAWAGAGTTLAFLAMVLLIGFFALVAGSTQLARVTQTLRGGVGKSFFAGILGGMAVAPAFVALVVALTVTIVGIIFIPLGVLAFTVIILGIGTLGFIAVAQLTGAALARGSRRDSTERGAELRALFTGILAYVALWVLVAALAPVPLIGILIRTFAVAATLVAWITGFGAVILTGFRKSNGVAAVP
jgi:hypothetical protein